MQAHLFVMISCLALFSVKTSEACQGAWLCTACFSQPLNSNDLLSEWQTQQMLTLSNAECLSSPLLLPCYGPQTRWAAWPPDSEWLRRCVCVSERVWMCMLQIDLPLVCHIKLALHWPPSCLQAAPYITQLSVALWESHSGLDRKVNNYNSWAMFYIPLAK